VPCSIGTDPKARDGREPTTAGISQAGEPVREPDVRLRLRNLKRAGGDADDRDGLSVECQRLADRVGGASEAPLRQPIADHGDRLAIIDGFECSSRCQRPVDGLEEGLSYHGGIDQLGRLASGSFGVIRGKAGSAEVHLASPGFNVMVHKNDLRVLRFAGDKVTSANNNEKVTAEKRGDDWLISVNDFYFYSIPEAVSLGG